MGFAAKEMKRLMGKAIHTHRMIHDGDHLLVAVSGGKDSLSLLWLLRERIHRIPIRYRITAVHVDPGFGTDSAAQMTSFFLAHGFDYRVIKTQIGPQAHSPNNRENPCFLCSRMRRKILFELAGEIGCNRIAFGHHKDDIIETFFLNVFYGASISTMLPVQEFFGGELTAIRPLYLIDEDLIQAVCKGNGMGADRNRLSERRHIQKGGNPANASRPLPVKQKDQGEYLPRIAECEPRLSLVTACFHKGV